MGKTRDLFKKIGDMKISYKMGMVKDRKGKDLTETEEIKKGWYRRTVQKKASMTWITTMVWSLI